MKTIYKFLSLVFVLTVSVSCDRDQGDTDYLNNRENIIFFSNNVGVLLVEEDAANTFSITVGAAAVASSNLAYTITVDPSSTAVEGVDFNMPNSTTSFNAGELTSAFEIEAEFENAITTGKTIIFNLTSTDQNLNVSSNNKFTLDLIKLCPITAPFVGDYQLSIIANGIFDTPTFTPGVVTLSVGVLPTDRVFSAAPYPAFGVFPPIDFNFSLICSNIIVPGGQLTFVGCGSSTTLGPQELLGSFDPDDDSVFTISLADDEGGASCGAQADATIMLTKI
jgi:hypothetical protein